MIFVDEFEANANWVKQSWELPDYKSDDFMELLKVCDLTLEEFSRLEVYRNAVRSGLIVNNEWVGVK